MKLFKKWGNIAAGCLLLLATVATVILVVAERIPIVEYVTAEGRSNVRFDVYYFENELFPENPVPPGFHFLRHMTDFISIQSGFTASFSEEFDLHYRYTARTRFVITYGAGGSAVYERVTELSDISGRLTADNLNFDAENVEGAPGGTYIIDPRVYYEIFNNFVMYAEQHEGDGAAANLRGLTSELAIEFSYSVTALPINISENITTGFNIPITQNVFTLESFGTPSFTTQISRTVGADPIEPSIMILLTFGLIISVCLIVYGFMGLSPVISENQKKADSILKKYGTEIVVSRKPLVLDSYQLVRLDDFEDMVKLSINLAKHITCYRSLNLTVFYIFVDGFAYCQVIKYDSEDEKKPIEDMLTENEEKAS